MKKLIFISLIGLLFSSCSSIPEFQDYTVVTNINSANNYCIYKVYHSNYQLSFFSHTSDVIDSCGKFQIGDTIKLYKK